MWTEWARKVSRTVIEGSVMAAQCRAKCWVKWANSHQKQRRRSRNVLAPAKSTHRIVQEEWLGSSLCLLKRSWLHCTSFWIDFKVLSLGCVLWGVFFIALENLLSEVVTVSGREMCNSGFGFKCHQPVLFVAV